MTQTTNTVSTQAATQYSKLEIKAMREWLSDCVWGDTDSEVIADMADGVIVRAIARHYEGGVFQFIYDMN